MAAAGRMIARDGATLTISLGPWLTALVLTACVIGGALIGHLTATRPAACAPVSTPAPKDNLA